MLAIVATLLGKDDTFSALLRLLGRLHPAVVHFPIALLVIAAVLETWQLIRRKPGLAAATPACLGIGAASAVAASVFGWLLAEDGSGLVNVHQWVGIVSTGGALLVAGLAWASRETLRRSLRPTLFVVAGLVGATGYLGGELVFGRNHLFRGIFDDDRPVASVSSSAAASEPPHKVDFTKDVVPILKDNCLRCHGGEKSSGKLSLKTRERAMKGGKSGKCIDPGHAEKSALYTLLVDKDCDCPMPPPREKQLSAQQIATVRQWIDEGADWPEGVEVK